MGITTVYIVCLRYTSVHLQCKSLKITSTSVYFRVLSHWLMQSSALHMRLKDVLRKAIDVDGSIHTEEVYSEVSECILACCENAKKMYEEGEEQEHVKFVRRFVTKNVTAYSGRTKYNYIEVCARKIRMALNMQGGRGKYKISGKKRKIESVDLPFLNVDFLEDGDVESGLII